MNKNLLVMAISLAVSGAAVADFGADTDAALKAQSPALFGFTAPIDSSETVSVPRAPGQTATDLIKLADGLTAEILTRSAGQHTDMMAFWPNGTAPNFIITCVEDTNTQVGTYDNGLPRFAPSVQRINVKSGTVTTILRGLSRCDGIRRTPWQTIVVTEEQDDGGMYEILDPTKTFDLTIERGTNNVINNAGKPISGKVAYRPAVGTVAWEGLDLTKEGVVYFGDEERPGSEGTNADGGALFKFVPSAPLEGNFLVTLDQSPLVAGTIYAYQASCQGKTSSSFPQFGQGCEIGQGAWVKVSEPAFEGATLRNTANANGATGFYRPEDGHFDINYTGPGVKFCWNNTGNGSAQNWGEVVCLTDTTPLGTGEKAGNAGTNSAGLTYLADSVESRGFAVATANRVLEGDADLNAPDNLAFQPKTGNMYVIEDNPFGDVWACLKDGADRDIKTDGCVKVLSVRDSSAEPTGFMFSGDGKTAYVSIQHSNDPSCTEGTDCAPVNGHATDDIVKITGFQVP